MKEYYQCIRINGLINLFHDVEACVLGLWCLVYGVVFHCMIIVVLHVLLFYFILFFSFFLIYKEGFIDRLIIYNEENIRFYIFTHLWSGLSTSTFMSRLKFRMSLLMNIEISCYQKLLENSKLSSYSASIFPLPIKSTIEARDRQKN